MLAQYFCEGTALTYSHRKPRLSDEAIARASGASVMMALQGLDLGLAQQGQALAGDCPRCQASGLFSIDTTGSWSCRNCGSNGVGGISLMGHPRKVPA
jgi:hypothetical protein